MFLCLYDKSFAQKTHHRFVASAPYEQRVRHGWRAAALPREAGGVPRFATETSQETRETWTSGENPPVEIHDHRKTIGKWWFNGDFSW